jgi:hypothetical protein
VRPPLTRFAALGQEGHDRVARLMPIIEEAERITREVWTAQRQAAQ